MATIRRRNSKYQVQIRRVGISSVTRSFISKQDAQRWARIMELRVDRRDLPPDPKILEQTTLGQLVERYRDTVSPKKKTHFNEKIVLNAFLRHPICRQTLAQLTPADFAAYRDDRLRNIQPSSLKRALVPIRHLFEIARDEWGYPIPNPVSKLKIGGLDPRRERRLREGELFALLRALSACRNRYMRPLVLLALSTGMRRSELLRLTSDQIDLDRRTILVAEGKNGLSRVIPLSKEALAALTEVPLVRGRLFPVSPNAVRLSWEHVRAKAGLHDLHFHDLRHEAISRLFEIGLSVPEVALISGHKDSRMLFRYSHAIRETILSKFDRSSSECPEAHQHPAQILS